MSMMLRRHMMRQAGGGGAAVLLHQYTYGDGPVAIGEYSGFLDEVGSFDLATSSAETAWFRGNTSDTDAARASWGIYPGDSFTCVFSGIYRATNYPQSQGFSFMLSGARSQNASVLGRDAKNRIFGVLQDVVSSAGAAPLKIRYYENDGGTAKSNTSELTCIPKNGTPADIKLTYDGSSGNVKAYVDGVLFNDFTHPNASLVHIDGLAMKVENLVTNRYWGFSEIKIYSGIA